MTVYGVDIHAKYQAGISFPKLRIEGYGFAVMKFTEGTSVSYLSSAKDWIPQIRSAGLIPGGYHWINAGDGAAQARYFWNHVRAVGGPEGMLIQLDCEDDATEADVTEWVNEWNRLSAGHPFLIYSGSWWWNPRGWNGTKWTPYLWHSHYLSADTDTVSDDVAAFASRIPASWWTPGYGGWSPATILQFTSKGDAGTLGNNVDLNVYKGSLADLARLTNAPAPPQPPSVPNWTEVLVGKLPTLRRGSTGTAVKRLQALLNVAGQRLTEDGDFGPKTDTAVRTEQSQARIAVDGIVGRQTWSKLLGV
jgi:GH25 family lysozyme M1 (1,4-beta-N-acetylmuramidase)